jgi:hypothetical protein
MCCDGFWSNEAKGLTDAVSGIGKNIIGTIENIIKNPLPTIETVVLIASGVPPAIASAAVTAMNGGSLEDAVKAGVTSYAAGQVGDYAKGQISNTIASNTGADYSNEGGLRSGTTTGSSLNAPLSSIGGRAVAGGTQAALSGKDVGQGLASGAASGLGSEAGKYAAQQFDDPFTKRVVSGGASGATKAALAGGDILGGAATGAATEGVNYGLEKGINYVTNEIGLGSNYDKQIADLITNSASGGGQANRPAASSSTQISGAAEGSASPAAFGGSASPAAFGAADFAMLDDTSQAGLGSKVSKKGGKYPWGEPEGTSALKEGLGI